MRSTLLTAALVCLSGTWISAAEHPNVLWLMCDDLAANLGCYGERQAITPNLDKLAARSVLFERAYCQFPHCNPSRSSIMTSLRPNLTRVTNNEDNLYDNIPNVMTMPHYFRDHGYATARCGKIFHLGVPTGLESMDDPKAWDFGTPFRDERPYPKERPTAIPVTVTKKSGLEWTETTGTDLDLVDGQFAATGIEWLEKRDPAKPFFLAIGFHRPHMPLVAPAAYYDQFSFDAIGLPQPPAPADDEADIPMPARNGAVPGYAKQTTVEQRRAAILAYLACVSFVDAQVGRVLAKVDELGLANDTIVIFTSDHGWHLGEHGLWHKRSCFEESARVPLIVHVPGAKANGQRCASVVELLDLYPTLCDLCGVPPAEGMQGKSLKPLLNDPSQTLHDAAFTEARRGPNAEFWGRSVRTPRWRYTEWNGGQDGVELYDHDADPREYTNLAADPKYASTVAELKKLAADGRATTPPAAN